MPAARWINPDGSRMVCAAPECDRPIKGRGYCEKHLQRLRKHGDINYRPGGSQVWLDPDGNRILCKLEGCSREVKSLGYCSTHWAQTRKGLEPSLRIVEQKKCVVEGCGRPHCALGYCNMHYSRVALQGDPGPVESFNSPPWRSMDGSRLECRVRGCTDAIQAKEVCMRHYNYLRYYGLDLEQIGVLFRPENRKCANPGCGSKENLHLDHDHSCCPPAQSRERGYKSCGACVRGWLCRRCNSILGFTREDVTILEGLVSYLEGNF